MSHPAPYLSKSRATLFRPLARFHVKFQQIEKFSGLGTGSISHVSALLSSGNHQSFLLWLFLAVESLHNSSAWNVESIFIYSVRQLVGWQPPVFPIIVVLGGRALHNSSAWNVESILIYSVRQLVGAVDGLTLW